MSMHILRFSVQLIKIAKQDKKFIEKHTLYSLTFLTFLDHLLVQGRPVTHCILSRYKLTGAARKSLLQ